MSEFVNIRNTVSKVARVMVMLTVVVVLASTVSACGRKNAPIPPDGSTYPQDYPTE
jgi:hypothetical protein